MVLNSMIIYDKVNTIICHFCAKPLTMNSQQLFLLYYTPELYNYLFFTIDVTYYNYNYNYNYKRNITTDSKYSVS